MKTKQRCLAIILIIATLFTFIRPTSAFMLEERFNLGYNNSAGVTIVEGFYSDPSIPISFSKLADRALDLKLKNYSYTSAMQILNETKAILKKTTVSDYAKYKELYEDGIKYGTNIIGRFTYDSFIMRNVLYAMYINDASYTQMLNAIQIVYDCGVIQSQKKAFRSDALDVLRDLNIIASYETDKDKAEMLFYVSKIASGTNSNYNGSSTIPSINVANKYHDYLEEQAAKDHYVDNGGHTGDSTEDGDNNQVSGGVGDVIYYPEDERWENSEYWEEFESGDYYDADNFSDILDKLHGGKNIGSLILFYTVDKKNEEPSYYKTRITTSQFVTYENIVTALLTASRNTDLILIEDTDAVLLVHNGSCTVLVQSDKKYSVEDVAELFLGLQDFGLFLAEESDVKLAK